MRYLELGRTGPFVSELCLGTMMFGSQGNIWGKIGQVGHEAALSLLLTQSIMA